MKPRSRDPRRAVAAGLGSNGLEGITASSSGKGEQVFVALQRALTTEPGVASIGRYDVASGVWTWCGYPLDTGSGIGLSELVALDRDTFGVIERDNLPGTFAKVKKIYTFDLPRDPRNAPAPALTLLAKTLTRDLLPDLRAGNGWVQEKVEGLAVGGDRRVYAVTDNDGVEDATGETLFLRLGSACRVFGMRQTGLGDQEHLCPRPRRASRPARRRQQEVVQFINLCRYPHRLIHADPATVRRTSQRSD